MAHATTGACARTPPFAIASPLHRSIDRVRTGMARTLALVLVVLLVPAGSALAAARLRAPGGTAPASGGASAANPCIGPQAATLLCPNLRMGTPVDLYAEISKTRTFLRATNRIQNWGAGPME